MGETTPALKAKKSTQKASYRAQIRKIDLQKEKLELKRLRLEVQGEQFKVALEASKKTHQCTYVFNKPVNTSEVESCRATLDQWHLLYPDAPFTIEFNSPGGSVFDGWALYDTIRENSNRGHHVTTIALGYAASMAGVLLQSGDTRLIGRQSQIMIHEVSSSAIGKVSELQDSVELSKQLTEQMARLYSERSKKTAARGKHLTAKQILVRSQRTDWWIGSAEALALGFVDRVVG